MWYVGNKVYGPYGTERYKSGPMPTYTTKGFTGQYADAVTGLDYYNARYYDPVAGVFLSADSVQGNVQGMNPYGYVNGNPETNTDPTGRYYAPPGGPGGPTPPPCNQSNNFCGTGHGGNPGGPSQKKTQVKLEGCNPDTNQSDACAAWAWRASKVRDQRLAELNQRAIFELLAGYGLFLVGDLLSMLKGDLMDRIGAAIDFITTVLNGVLPLFATAFPNSAFAQAVNRFASWGSGILSGLDMLRGVIGAGNWIEKNTAEFTANLLLASASGPAGIFVQGLMIVLKPALGYLLDSGGHYLQSLGFADLSEEARQGAMPLQGWCAQYGGCPSYSS